MGCRRSVYFFIALAIIKVIAAANCAEHEEQETNQRESEMERASPFGSNPLFNGLGSFGSNSGMPDFSAIFNSFMPGSGSMPDFSSLFGGALGGSRNKRSVEERHGTDGHGNGHNNEEAIDGRLFFRFPTTTTVTCNSTTQAGSTCLSCTQALRCGANNVGSLRTCRGFFPYCNLGQCTFFPGAQCLNTTAVLG